MDRPLNVPNILALVRIVMTPLVMTFVLLSEQIDHAFGIALAADFQRGRQVNDQKLVAANEFVYVN